MRLEEQKNGCGDGNSTPPGRATRREEET